MVKNFAVIAGQLLGRELNVQDGISIQEIEKAEKKLSVQLPESLKQFYLHAGNVELFMSSFNEFMKPEELTVEDNRLIFAEENQGVCAWGVELTGNSSTVWMVTDNNGVNEWYAEKYDLPAFINLMVYYNCCQGGFEYGGMLDAVNFWENAELQADLKKWDKVAHDNGLVILAHTDNLIWYFYGKDDTITEGIFLSCRTENNFEALCEKYGFTEL